MIEKEKVFFQPGDTVTLKQNISNKPKMIVVRKEMNVFKDQPSGIQLKGIRCRWFTTDGKIQEATFSTKDLQLVEHSSED